MRIRARHLLIALLLPYGALVLFGPGLHAVLGCDHHASRWGPGVPDGDGPGLSRAVADSTGSPCPVCLLLNQESAPTHGWKAVAQGPTLGRPADPPVAPAEWSRVRPPQVRAPPSLPLA